MDGNPGVRQIPWEWDQEKIDAWDEGRTGFPWIDAIMSQLRAWGWMHHLARHSVAAFLTRGDLFQHWESGARIFDKYLIDADYFVNNANWQWLSASRFFYQYFRCYSPVSFGRKWAPPSSPITGNHAMQADVELAVILCTSTASQRLRHHT
jgi:cryptochrome